MRIRSVAVLIAISLVGGASVLGTTRLGIGTSPDSIRYVQAAYRLLGEEPSTSVSFTGGPEANPLTHFAPLFPVVLAAGVTIGLPPLNAARILNGVLAFLNAFVAGWIMYRSTAHVPGLWLAAPLLMVGSIPMLVAHASALSEPLFIFFMLTGFWQLTRHLEAEKRPHLLLSAILLGLGLLARYAGVTLLISAAITLVTFGHHHWVTRLKRLFVFFALSVLPMSTWALWSMSEAGTATGRDLAFHPVGPSHAWQALYTASFWLHIPSWASNALRIGAWSGLGCCAVLLLLLTPKPETRGRLLARVLGTFVAVYMGFLALSLSLFDANTPLDDRILLPVFVAGVFIGLHFLDSSKLAIARSPVASGVAYSLVIAFVGLHTINAAKTMTAGYSRGWGLSSVAWQRSPTIAGLRALPEGVPLFSNAPEIIYLHAGRTAGPLPKTRFLMSGQANENIQDDFDDLGRQLGDCGFVVYFRTLSGQKAVPSEQTLTSVLGLRSRSQYPDGVILTPSSCPE